MAGEAIQDFSPWTEHAIADPSLGFGRRRRTGMARRQSQLADRGIVAPAMLEVPVPVDLSHEGDRLLARAERPIDPGRTQPPVSGRGQPGAPALDPQAWAVAIPARRPDRGRKFANQAMLPRPGERAGVAGERLRGALRRMAPQAGIGSEMADGLLPKRRAPERERQGDGQPRSLPRRFSREMPAKYTANAPEWPVPFTGRQPSTPCLRIF